MFLDRRWYLWAHLNVFQDFINLIYPKVCISCGVGLFKYETYLCTKCRYSLPRAYFHRDIERSLIRRQLYGRVPVFGSAAYYLFVKKTGVQHILHHIKYKKGKELAQYIGRWMGAELKQAEWFKDAELLVPVPLHPKKQLERGYNQSEEYSKGISAETNVCVRNVLRKNIYTSTQTRKRRYERWKNVQDNFLTDEDVRGYKHLVLIDDVMTTGATFESAYRALVQAGFQGKVSIITMAVATTVM